jgi:polysaccharide biosynthesis protein PslJ
MASIDIPARPIPAALRSSARSINPWAMAVAGFVLAIWLIPIKRYRLPVDLPFELEVYRVLIAAALVLFTASVLGGRARFSAAGHGKPVALFAAGLLASQLVNLRAINEAGVQDISLKTFAVYVSYIVVFVLVTSMIQSNDDVQFVVVAIVLGAAIVAPLALWEGKVKDSPFYHLDEWIPFFDRTKEVPLNFRGRLRVRASAQHPIALGAVLALTLPLAFYVWHITTSSVRRLFWLGSAILIAAASLATISRTVVLMFAAMALVALFLRGASVARFWPLVVALAVVTQFAAPGAIKQLYRSLTPEEGLVQEQTGREGMQGSGRVSDLGPGLERWQRSPVFGDGVGTNPTRGEVAEATNQAERIIIYDNQWMLTLVTLGAVGLIAVAWLVWGAAGKVFRAARERQARLGRDPPGGLLVACAASCAAFGVSMFTFDAFAFVQVTLLFLIIAALGLRLRALSETELDSRLSESPR